MPIPRRDDAAHRRPDFPRTRRCRYCDNLSHSLLTDEPRRGAPVFNEVVVEECSKYAFSAWERLQISAECSVRNNIETFLQKMLLLRLDQ